MDLSEALKWLEDHVNMEAVLTGGRAAVPTLDRMSQLVGLLGDPQHAYPVVHITGTNGKGSTARMLTELLGAKGLRVGTYTSPDLQRLNERLAHAGEPIADEELAEQLSAIADLEVVVDEVPSRFEILTAAAFRWFADVAVDVAVIEVGLGGRWDATNVADGAVAVVTNVALDHVELLGPSRRHIAVEKAGIVKPGSTLVLGEDDAELRQVFLDTPAEATVVRGEHFACESAAVSVGGRLLSLRTPRAHYTEVFLPLHGAHQGANAAVALTAAEAFFGETLHADVVADAFAAVRNPGRMEVAGRRPLVLLDGAHNPAGAAAAAKTLDEEFAAVEGRVLVIGLNQGRDADEMLRALGAQRAKHLVAVPPPSPRRIDPDQVVAAARRLGIEGTSSPTVAEGIEAALTRAGPDDLVLVTGSLYVVGAARTALGLGVG